MKAYPFFLLLGLVLLVSACVPSAVDPTPPGFPVTLGQPWVVTLEDRSFGFVLTRNASPSIAEKLEFYIIRGTDSTGKTVEASSLMGAVLTVHVYEQRFEGETPSNVKAYSCRAVNRDGRWLGNSFYGTILQEVDAMIQQLKPENPANRPPNCEIKPAGQVY